jgi:fatty-acyl-CoA synthase
MFIALLNQSNLDEFDFSSLRTGIMAGSPCPIKVMEDVVKRMRMSEITIAYGQTESSPVSTQTTIDDPIEIRVSTVGKAIPHIECKIVDPETGKTLLPNTPGEFCSRGYNTMKGYYKMPEATAQVIDDEGWLHSGDLAMVDENGYYKITGRIKDMIIRGGENIYPKEIEEFLYTLEQIEDAQVIGVPSEHYGEEICACIILKKHGLINEDNIKNAVASSMAKHKTPSYVWFMESFPVTASGKIQKYKLRERAIEKFGLSNAGNIETA